MSPLDWFKSSTRREQVLLALMAALVAVLILWFAVITPLKAWREGAERRYDEALAVKVAVDRDLARIAVLEKGSAGRPRASGPVEQRARQAAVEAGLDIARADTVDGDLVVWLEGASPTAAFGWLAALHREDIAVRRLTVLKNDTGGLDVEVGLAGRS
ncbi:type II secretion system protein GspM [Caulobacter sp. NIBR2454]|uniref:type II secretion system protein GspM n=1 Tax=Caulobacter sp. NIBR2454 TaxID=3015996 RepID=UPI0022B61182|nr:type II secretion system protein GspM [Caulobacter sp. NIBR2454]